MLGDLAPLRRRRKRLADGNGLAIRLASVLFNWRDIGGLVLHNSPICVGSRSILLVGYAAGHSFRRGPICQLTKCCAAPGQLRQTMTPLSHPRCLTTYPSRLLACVGRPVCRRGLLRRGQALAVSMIYGSTHRVETGPDYQKCVSKNKEPR